LGQAVRQLVHHQEQMVTQVIILCFQQLHPLAVDMVQHILALVVLVVQVAVAAAV
jgi:hypothetical protein